MYSMKKISTLAFACCLLVACGKDKETDLLANTTWESGKNSENTNAAIAYGAIYYGDGSACTELLEFTDYGCVWRYLLYHGEKIKYNGCPSYELNGNTITIENDTTHKYTLDGNTIVGYYLSGEKDGIFYKK